MIATGALAVVSVSSQVGAQGRLEAKYEASVGGLAIGTGTWVVDIADDQYSMTLTGATAGLMKAVGGGTGSGVAQGRMSAGQFVPTSYVSSVFYGKKNETIRIVMSAGGTVKSSLIEPEQPINPDRVPITEAHRHGVSDPMTASVLRVAGTGDPVSPAACQNTAAVFDGRMRYDLRFEYKRMEMVKAEKGYQGPAVVCAIYFTPIAGYVPDRASIKYIAAQRNAEMWFAPIAGTRSVAPFRIIIPTPVGTGLVEAIEFVSAPLPRTAKTN